MAMNMVVLTGRLTRDPEIRYTQSGKAVANLSLAVGRRFNKDETDFFDCTAWGKTAEIAAEYLRKGNQVGVTGNLRQNRFEVEGQKRSKVEVTIEQLEFLESKKASGSFDNNSDSNLGKSEVVEEDEFPF